jgi:peptide/nickel transport system permease protein
MGGFVLRKVGAALIVLFIASLLVFAGARALPGDPALALGGEDRSPAVLAQIRHGYGLDQPLPVQYGRWVAHVVRGDFGRDQRELSVSHTIINKLPITLELAGLSVLIGTLLGIPAGILAAARRGKPADYASTTLALIGLSVPHFWLGLMMISLFAVKLDWLPAGDYVSISHPLANLEHMVMPAFVLGTGLSAIVMRQMRSAMLESMSSDYVRTARAKGLPERSVVLKHALRNALVPIVTLSTLLFGELLGGAVLTEQVFSIPGFGKLVVDAVFTRDYAVVQGVVLCTAFGFIVLNLLADGLYVLINPRLRGGA